MTLKQIVDDYIVKYRKNAEKELLWFEIQKTIECAVSIAALAMTPSGKKFDHQRRIPKKVLEQAKQELLNNLNLIQSVKDFDELHKTLSQIVRNIKGIGELYIYDTALRIGAYIGYEPKKVYLHSDTLQGAKKLGIDTSKGFVLRKDLPIETTKLKPREIEDCLCIYKNEF